MQQGWYPNKKGPPSYDFEVQRPLQLLPLPPVAPTTTPADDGSGGGSGDDNVVRLRVCLGESAEQALPAALSPDGALNQLPPQDLQLGTVRWNPNDAQAGWIACGGSSGLVVCMRV